MVGSWYCLSFTYENNFAGNVLLVGWKCQFVNSMKDVENQTTQEESYVGGCIEYFVHFGRCTSVVTEK
ncbi:hypothetical protein RUM43_012384 [Polyplax serrata]|uniref:Uncharacterized protein n=1 Tax=Polyplax serrata TaxID=468196 RepID=A0AAN8P7E8_POLSC